MQSGGGNNNNNPKPKTFKGFDNSKEEKKFGANAPGEFGGIYSSPDKKDTAIFKCETSDNGEVAYAKVIAEFVAGQFLAAMLAELHPDEPDYAEKLVANVSLVEARPDDNKNRHKDDLIYLQSIFLKNYGGDFWEWAHARKPRGEILEQYKIDTATRQKELYPAMTDDEIQAIVTQHVADLDNVFNKMAKREVAEHHPKGKPKAVIPALLKNFEAPAISIPSHALLENETLLADFCDQAAARILVSDYGIHPGNFGIVAKDGNERLASLDYGAGLRNLYPDAALFSRKKKETGTKFYKNHLLEYDPRVIKSEQMAKSLINLGKLSDDFFKAKADAILTTKNIRHSRTPLMKFCKHLGMQNDAYTDKKTVADLLDTAKKFIVERLAARRDSMLKQGYGLLYEHCINKDGELDEKTLTEAKQKFPEFASFIKEDLKDYTFVLYKKQSTTFKDKAMRGYALSLPVTPTTYAQIEQDILHKINVLKKSALQPQSKQKLIEDIQLRITAAQASSAAPMTKALTAHIDILNKAIYKINLLTDSPTAEPFLNVVKTEVFTGNNSLDQAKQAAFAFIENETDNVELYNGDRQFHAPEGETNRFIATNFSLRPSKPVQVPVALIQTTNAEKSFTHQTAFMPPGSVQKLNNLPYFTRDKIEKIKEQMRFVCNLIETSMAAIQTNGPVTISNWGDNLSKAAAVYCHYMGYELSPKQLTDKITPNQMVRFIGDFQNQIEEDQALKTYIEEAKARREMKMSKTSLLPKHDS